MWSKNKGLSDKELYDILMQSSDDECDKELPLEQAFSDFSSDEDLSDGEAEIHEGSLSFHELEEEEVQLPDQLEDETLRNRQSYDVDNRTWYTVAPKTGKSRSCNILQEDKGLTNRSKDVNSITDCFKLFFSENMLDIIIKYTNKKANDFIKTYNECHEDKLETWIEVDTTEMLAFLGVLILAGRFREAKESVRNLWSTTNNAFTRPIYQATMSRNRFSDILRHLRFDDLSTRAERKEQDKLAPIREITDIFAKNCRESYKPSAFGTIDEQLVTFRGRCSFKVYIPSKPGNYYCCNFEVYLGKLNGIAEKNQGPRVVKTLASHWYGRGRNITTDNFFTDITLAEELLSQNLTIVGTIRKTRKDLPKSLLDIRERATYSSQFLFTRNLTLVSYVTKRNKFVVLLSSMHHEHDIAGEDLKFKPSIITSYNETKSGVDCLDKIVREYSSKRISRRWPLRLFYN
ncbi:piggyBac transposable element-derived protein 5-like [Sitophilus oryzae]|uniref:PiggyBac transposable element-derived protein 5-like n=1 Tax=Sitophilus oryzae TaxID=7048 RepID=A0A6J2XD97_SITOR|nr:piggyBac transposable element-derived protein 5-like [Sitophilus oryzae]